MRQSRCLRSRVFRCHVVSDGDENCSLRCSAICGAACGLLGAKVGSVGNGGSFGIPSCWEPSCGNGSAYYCQLPHVVCSSGQNHGPVCIQGVDGNGGSAREECLLHHSALSLSRDSLASHSSSAA